MIGFLLGIISAWITISLAVLIGDRFDLLYKDWFIWLCAFLAASIVWTVWKLYQIAKKR